MVTLKSLHFPSTAQQSVFCVFKCVRAVKQKVLSEAENGQRDLGETLKYVGQRAYEARALGAWVNLTQC